MAVKDSWHRKYVTVTLRIPPVFKLTRRGSAQHEFDTAAYILSVSRIDQMYETSQSVS